MRTILVKDCKQVIYREQYTHKGSKRNDSKLVMLWGFAFDSLPNTGETVKFRGKMHTVISTYFGNIVLEEI